MKRLKIKIVKSKPKLRIKIVKKKASDEYKHWVQYGKNLTRCSHCRKKGKMVPKKGHSLSKYWKQDFFFKDSWLVYCSKCRIKKGE